MSPEAEEIIQVLEQAEELVTPAGQFRVTLTREQIDYITEVLEKYVDTDDC